ncbi:MAG: TIGR00159 family protein [Armatimonadetes bacterium]|nr:TIGR00159 family protein [Armatimonadota bacterium]
MSDFFSVLFNFPWQAFINVLDILLVAYVTYRLFKLIRGKRAWRIVVGVFVFVAALVLSDWLQLNTLHWVLDKAALLAPVALVILFLPELRQAVEGFGKLGIWTERLIGSQPTTEKTALHEISKAVAEMAEHRIGALIVIERGTTLQDVADNGIPVHAKVTAPLVGAMFYHGNPLHDGAIVIRRNEVVAAACRLPMSESRSIDPHYHMRHRAGIGMSEQSDAVVIIVSEERGDIAVAMDGEMTIMADEVELRETLEKHLRAYSGEKRKKRRRRRKKAAAPQEEPTKEAGQ